MQAALSRVRPDEQGAGTPQEIRSVRPQQPDIGASIIAEFLDVLPDAEIHLFGFTHQGKQHTHDWDAEKQWVQQLCDEGRIHKHLTPGPKPRRSLKGRLEYAFRFLEKRAKHYLHNKILHSSESTKRRIFGQDA